MTAEGRRLQAGTTLAEADQRLMRRSRLASAGLMLVLLSVSLFGVWSSQATSAAVSEALSANDLSDEYARAATAVNGEESLVRKYRLEPRTDVRVLYNGTAAVLVAALEGVRTDGSATDRAVVDAVLVKHSDYLEAAHRLFAAVDRGDTALALRIDNEEADPLFRSIESTVRNAAVRHRAFTLERLQHLRGLETFTQRLTPAVFLIGLVLAGLLASITRGHRRILDRERTVAVHDSLHDALTGLPNRKLLADRCSQALLSNAELGTSSGLLLIDLDRFKEINDTFGHHYGDELLMQVGPRLAAVLRDIDTVARLGGDEFAVLLVDVKGVSQACEIAANLLAALEAPFIVEGVVLDVEASIGVVLSGVHGLDASTLLQHADIAMYIAKTRSCGVFAYDPAVDGHSPAKLALLGDLRRALERNELILHYQPKVSLSSGDVVGVEALVRWQHPQRGLLYPDDFILLAEHTGLIAPLTRYVLNAAIAQARKWSLRGRPLTVSVNLSARNLLDEQLPGDVAKLLKRHLVPAGMLELEVTESALMTEPLRARRLLGQLTDLGIVISIDDFGAGYTSLGQLKTLPISELKIDRSFVTNMVEDRSNALIVRSVVELGHNLGLTMVAEGVETKDALDELAEMGCDVAQGYYLSRPIAAEAFDRWLTTHDLIATPLTMLAD
ncbi:MAG: EAL domain-containing protein [Ilumatobacteraceae bacterium]